MESQTLGIVLTAILGLAGILSTHLLARLQRTSEMDRIRTERRDRYRFAEYELRSTLYADFLAEIRTLLTLIRLRSGVTGTFHRKWSEELARRARTAAESMNDPKFEETRQYLSSLAQQLDGNSALGKKFSTTGDSDLPPAVEPMPTIRRVTELAARIRLVGGADMAREAAQAEGVAIAALMRLAAQELRDSIDAFSTEDLERALVSAEEAAIYELRLLPFGEKLGLDELRRSAQRASEVGTDGERASGTLPGARNG
jgi:hypothetical protein